ncbi:MAG TPA: type VI secretion system tip protein TssI/VgrG [Blastocatellia bacterium]|nr:type VI secretion system tip protein TssI/VgrG [Blastocatellia bacterium]
MGAYTQDNRLIQINTPLGKDVLLLQGFNGEEGVSRLFHFDLRMHSENRSIRFESIVGQRATIRITLPDESERFINGVISSFSQGGSSQHFAHYNATLVPWLWLLTRTSDCRIFQNLSVPDILQKIFREYGFTDFKLKLHESYKSRDYCVQYRETDFNFVSRLMEEEGIFYFFEHEEDRHILVLADHPGEFKPCEWHQTVSYVSGIGEEGQDDIVTQWSYTQEIRPGKFEVRDFNFEQPSLNLAASIEGQDERKFEIYDYPGEYYSVDEGEALVSVRMEEEESARRTIDGAGTCRGFVPGFKFDLKNHYRKNLNQPYVLIWVQHAMEQGDNYETGSPAEAADNLRYANRFRCIPDKTPFRPPRITPVPLMQGTQTAIVVGPAGEEIYTDKYGRVKVQFHWDREGKRDENSSCWIRVSQPWAGKGWGGISIPRIGQEVIVDFIEGDPDRPIITGRVYNAESMPPYTLPAGMVVSGIKSQTHKGQGYNELNMDDTAGKEKINIHAQYDMITTVEHDDTQAVRNNRAITVDGTHTETIKKATSITITEGTYSHNVAANTATYHVKGALTENYDNTQKTTVLQDLTIDCKTKILITATNEIKLHTGASMIVMKSDGTIQIHGVKIEIIGTQEVKSGVGAQTVTLDRQKVTTSGTAISTTAVGTHELSGALIKLN